MLGLMAMLRVQDPIKVQKEYGHSAPSDRDSQQKQIFDQRFMRLVGRGLFCPVGRKSRECLPENVSVPKPTLVGRCSNCARHGASFKKTCCSLRAAATSAASSKVIRCRVCALSKCWGPPTRDIPSHPGGRRRVPSF